MAKNRFLNRGNEGIQSTDENLHSLLLNVMKEEFPEDENYLNGRTLVSHTADEPSNAALVSPDDLKLSKRGKNKVVSLNADNPEYSKYKLDKMLPSLATEDLDEILDDEWDFYVDPASLSAPRVDGLFLINKEISLNPPDFHNEYIKRGPATIQERIDSGIDLDTVIKTTFCVFFIQNSTALPIPNYKTLEVMLVERDKTYSDINEATIEQVRDFDMQLDGKYTADADRDINPVEEFRFRQVLDRSVSWNPRVRFDSGYTPGQDENAVQFERDPGDYLLIPGKRQNGFYDNLVYQKQTYREKLREKFEGKMIALQWPIPYDDTIVDQDPGIRSDDKVFLLRMMINGYWKQVIATNVLRQYALINNFDVSGIDFTEDPAAFDNVITGNYTTGYLTAGLYGDRGLTNVLIQNGGMTVFQDEDITQDDIDQITQGVRTFLNFIDPNDPFYDIILNYIQNVAAENKSPGWSDFAHIAEVDRLDSTEYEEYLDNYSNGGNPFDIEHLQPYEPPGSIAYYPSDQLIRLQVQANAQAQINAIKKQIMETLPQLAARAAELDQRFNAQPANYISYALENLGPNSDIYKVMFSNDKFKYIKTKNSGRFKQKNSDKQFMRLAEKADRLFFYMNKKEEDEIFYKPGTRDFTLLVEQGDSLLDTLDGYVFGNKRLFTEDTIQAIGERTLIQSILQSGVIGGAGGALATLGGYAAIGAAAGVVAGVTIGAALDVDITPRGQDDRKGLPRNFVGDRQNRLVKRGAYIKLIIGAYIYNTFVKKDVTGLTIPNYDSNGNFIGNTDVDLFDYAEYIDNSFTNYRSVIDAALDDINDIDERIINSNTLQQFQSIYDDLVQIETDFNNIDLDLFQKGEQLKIKVDEVVKYMVGQQYSAIQYARKSLNDQNKKYYIVWPADAKAAVENYFPGKTFDNYQDKDYTE